MAIALNQTGQQTLTVTGIPVALTLPTYTDYTDAPNGITRTQTPRHALIQVFDQPVRWASGEGFLSGAFGQRIPAGGELDWTDSRRDYYGVIDNMQFVLDSTATGNATVEVAYFA